MTTTIPLMVLRAALVRRGIWFVDVTGMPTNFVHNMCLGVNDVHNLFPR